MHDPLNVNFVTPPAVPTQILCTLCCTLHRMLSYCCRCSWKFNALKLENVMIKLWKLILGIILKPTHMYLFYLRLIHLIHLPHL